MEVRYRSFAVYSDRIEVAFELSGGMEDTADLVKHAKVGIFEVVYTCEGRITWFSCRPRPKRTFALNLTRRFRICESGVVFHRDIFSRGHQMNSVEVEFKRIFVFVLRDNS